MIFNCVCKLSEFQIKLNIISNSAMSRMMTLKDLKAREAQQTYGFNVEQSPQANFCRQCIDIFFPNFKLFSLTSLFVATCIVVFFVTLALDRTIMGNSEGEYEHWVCTMHTFQAKFTWDITHKYQVWRLLTAVFLHNSFLHLFWNSFSMLTFAFTVERYVDSAKNYALILLIGSYQGNVLSAILRPYTVGVGASGTIFALLGVLVIWFWLNYYRFGVNRHIFLVFLIVIGFFSLMNVLISQNIDAWGHLGGLIAGLPLGILMLKPQASDDEIKLKPRRLMARLFLVLLLVGSTVIMFVRPLPNCANNACENVCAKY